MCANFSKLEFWISSEWTTKVEEAETETEAAAIAKVLVADLQYKTMVLCSLSLSLIVNAVLPNFVCCFLSLWNCVMSFVGQLVCVGAVK